MAACCVVAGRATTRRRCTGAVAVCTTGRAATLQRGSRRGSTAALHWGGVGLCGGSLRYNTAMLQRGGGRRRGSGRLHGGGMGGGVAAPCRDSGRLRGAAAARERGEASLLRLCAACCAMAAGAAAGRHCVEDVAGCAGQSSGRANRTSTSEAIRLRVACSNVREACGDDWALWGKGGVSRTAGLEAAGGSGGSGG